MKLYLKAGACSLADHISLHEAGFEFDRINVDLKTKRTASGEDFTQINPKGYVPVLELDSGERLTENVAIMAWIAQHAPKLAPAGELGPIRLLEMLAFISSEVHKQFGPVLNNTGEAEAAAARKKIGVRFDYLAQNLPGDYLFGDSVSVADAYLFTMLRWAKAAKIDIPGPLEQFFERMRSRPAVKQALEHEGLE